jgi:hypothetical protein
MKCYDIYSFMLLLVKSLDIVKKTFDNDIKLAEYNRNCTHASIQQNIINFNKVFNRCKWQLIEKVNSINFPQNLDCVKSSIMLKFLPQTECLPLRNIKFWFTVTPDNEYEYVNYPINTQFTPAHAKYMNYTFTNWGYTLYTAR